MVMTLLYVNLLQQATLALIYAAVLIMLTIGLNMVYSVLKFSNFAHAEYVTLGMFMSWWSLQILTNALPDDNSNFINNLLVQAMFAFLVVGLFGVLGEILVYNRLRFMRASPRSFTVASIGIGLIARNFLAMVFGALPQPNKSICSDCTSLSSLPGWIPKILREDRYIIKLIPRAILNFIGVKPQDIYITGFELYIILVSIIMVFTVDFIFRHTKFGIAMRATSDSLELAQVSGVNTKRVIFYTWFLAAGLTGFGAAFVRANQPRFGSYDGYYMLLPIFAVVILGGVGSFRGGIIAAFILAYARQFTVILFTEFQWTGTGKRGYLSDLFKFPLEKLLEEWLGFTITFTPAYADGIGFIILIIVLLIRPQGIFGSVEATRARV